MNKIEPKTCTLRSAAEGQAEPCPGERCPFWEAGGAVAEAGCLIERLGVDVRSRDMAVYLLETRSCLERARDLRGAEVAHREFSRRVGLEL